jgi:glycosyltransferase involved in cell wall biosynthesis
VRTGTAIDSEGRPVTATFSIIVPTYNRPGALANCLSALARLDYPKERFEVIVVDDGSTCDLSHVFEQYRPLMRMNCLRMANAGPGAARNAGAAAAVHEFLAFTDDDCLPHRDWLRQLAAALSTDCDVLVGGQRRNALPDSLCAIASQTIIDVVNSDFNQDHEHAEFFPSDNMAVSRLHFMEIGGFDVSFRWSEDRDLCDRWSAQGRRLVLAPKAIVDHAREMGLWAFVRQHFGYGRGACRFHQARRRRNAGRLNPNGRFYLNCFRNSWIHQPLSRALPLAALLCVWQLANAAGFFYEAIKSRPTGA